PYRGDVDDVRVRWIDGDPADGLRVLEAEVRPVFAAVGGSPDAVSDRRALAVVGLAGADVDDVRVVGGDADCADGLVGLLVEHRLPVRAAVLRLPDAAGREAGVHDHGIVVRAGDVVHAPHHDGGPDGSERER